MPHVYFAHKEIELPEQALLDCHHSGSCDADCAYWAANLNLKRVGITPEEIRSAIREYGVDDTESMDESTLVQYMLWLCAADYQERSDDEN
jgi:hypothetical protein